MSESELHLKEKPTLDDFQEYALRMVKERGFDISTSQLFMLLGEEIGELSKAARKAAKMQMDAKSKEFDIHSEAADVFIVFLVLCNHLGINLEKAFREKEAINKQRVWK